MCETLGIPTPLERILKVKDIRDIVWRYGEVDKIDFGINPDRDKNIIELDFNINID